MASVISKVVEIIKPFDVYHEIYFKLCNERRQNNRYFEKIRWITFLIYNSNLNNIVATIYSSFYDYTM